MDNVVIKCSFFPLGYRPLLAFLNYLVIDACASNHLPAEIAVYVFISKWTPLRIC